MKKQLLVLLTIMTTCGAVLAGPVPRERAKAVAQNFAYRHGLKKLIQYELTESSTKRGYNEFYVFASGGGDGFVLVSKDDCVTPILGYSEQGSLPEQDLPEHIEAWLREYDNQIRFYREQGAGLSPEVQAEWAKLEQPGAKTSAHVAPAVSPLLTTTWNQLGTNSAATYNLFCPKVGSTHCVTGCVATAMAQVMKYWNWPRQGRGSKSYVWNSTTLSSTFADTVFHWERMPNELTTSSSQAEIEAVASLMYNVGIAVSMGYGTGSSGAFSSINSSQESENYSTVDVALRNYFHYKYTTNAIFSSGFSDAEWKNQLKMELNAGRPVLYSGDSQNGGGHAFVLDGYDSEGLFHVNWGWGGLADGYYAIGSLRPRYGGTGASATNTYDYNNSAIIGIEPVSTIAPENGTTTVTAIPYNASHGTVSGSGTYNNYGNMVVLTATPAAGYLFKCWSDGNRYNPRYIRATGGSQTYTACFAEKSSLYREYYNINNPGTCYYNGSTTVTEWGIKLPYDMISAFDYLDKVVFFAFPGTYTIQVYSGSNTSSWTEEYSTAYTCSRAGWDSIVLATPVRISSNTPLWITLGNTEGVDRPIDCEDSYSDDDYWERVNETWYYYSNGLPALIRGHFGFDGGTPMAPTGLTVSNVSSQGATIGWTLPSATLAITGYEVAYGVGTVPEMMETTVTTSNSVILTGLRNDTYYNVFVRAKYGTGTTGSEWVTASFRTYDATTITNPVVVTAMANEEGWGTVSGSGTYQSGTSVTLTATAMPGYQFTSWEDNTTSATRTVMPTADATYVAYFAPVGYTVTAVGEGGTVAIEGDGSWTDNGTTYYPYLSTVCLTPIPSAGYVFKQWNDGNTTNPRYITVTGPASYTATFASTGSKVVATGRELEVSVTTTETAPMAIYDMMGRCVYSGQATAGSANNVLLQTAGVYLVKVGSSFAEKIVVR